MIDFKYANDAWKYAEELLSIDSPTGFTNSAANWIRSSFEKLGFSAALTQKGGVLVDLGGSGEGRLLEAHTDTLGAMVAEIKPNGRLRVTPLGGMNANNAETENVRVYTRDGKIIEGTCQLINPSTHVNKDYSTTQRTFDSVEIVLDDDFSTREQVKAAGIDVGDIVCFDPRTRRTESGFLKSRFLDDKLSVGILLAFAKYISENPIILNHHFYVHITVFEEVGHGGSSSVPVDITEAVSVDMGCVGIGLQCTEQQVSICAKDSGGPYHYDVVTKLVQAAKLTGADYSIDIYPYYGSDVEATLRGGADIRHGLIGPGVYASHGYERSHINGVYNTLKVLIGYSTT